MLSETNIFTTNTKFEELKLPITSPEVGHGSFQLYLFLLRQWDTFPRTADVSKASALVRHFHSKRLDVDMMAGEYLFSYTRAIFNTPVL